MGNDVFFSKGSKTPLRFWSFWKESRVMVRFRDGVRVRVRYLFSRFEWNFDVEKFFFFINNVHFEDMTRQRQRQKAKICGSPIFVF